ncbi:hypothetical protein IVB46_13305 [Bradyrhizobium sp. 61]|uniref:hypothetical protein n=1 Tax=Bradyrhizobium sp. 61 TaxID=2782679 RepID=UPI001FF91957|nr:hypothetical protein [Bradyrhizobium sp. 61]MCK1276191.1 hypothetical protein [Bradyrhizobium sp. 61]
MKNILEAAEVGDIEIFIDAADPSQNRLTVPIVLRDGREIELKLGPAEYRAIWEMLAALRAQYPKALGIQ